jgi:2-polyprenyl-3-methyl-5-hydroxy-6-metoxy-1,4-benzoquinol methylase
MTAYDALPTVAAATPGDAPAKRIAVYVVARDVVHSLARVLDRIPGSVRDRVTEVLVFDAGSRDDTYLVGMGFKAVSGQANLTVMRGESGGFGANNKRAITYCIERGYDIMVLLHGDGKYAPEVLDQILAPLERGEADAVFGSRFLTPGGGRHGMPWHKEVAVRALGVLARRVVGLGLRDWHCGYRAYDLTALRQLPYGLDSDDLHFDTEIAIQHALHGLRIAEVPVPPYTGDETGGLRGIRYAANILRVLGQYWLHRSGFREYPKFAIVEKYVYKTSHDASHQRLLALLDKDRRRVLDVGCGAGYLAEALAVRGNVVVGVDARRAPGVAGRVAEFIQVDLDRDPIPWSGPPFHFVVLADVIEHLREPDRLLARCRELLADDGALLVSVPNVAHWSVRLALLAGRFPYAARGILDRSHLRFFTLASIRTEISRAGFVVDRMETTTPPLEQLFRGRILGSLARFLNRLQAPAARVWPGLFAYQIVLRVRKTRDASGPAGT